MVKDIKVGVYDGLVNDLMNEKAYQLCQVIYSEKMREKHEMTIRDHLIGLEIFAAQRKLVEYEERYKEIVSGEHEPVSQHIAEELGRTLMLFSNDEAHKQNVTAMATKLQSVIADKSLFLTDQLFDSLIYVFTESQQWSKVNSLLTNANLETAQPMQKTVSFLKRNLVYCFDPTMRS